MCIPAFAAEETLCSVNYTNASQFIFNPENGDLFQNFKGVMPGDELSQKIALKNQLSTRDLTLYLRAEVDETYKDFLNYITIKVTLYNEENPNGKILCTNKASEAGALAEAVSLGTYNPGETGSLEVSITMDKLMGNEFKKASGIIEWIFSAEEGEEIIIPPPDIPDTGSDKPIVPIVVGSIAVVALVVCIVLTKKKKDETSESKNENE